MCDHKLCAYLEDRTRCCFRAINTPGSGPAVSPIPPARMGELRVLWRRLAADDWPDAAARELATKVHAEVLSRNMLGQGGLLKNTIRALELEFGEKK